MTAHRLRHDESGRVTGFVVIVVSAALLFAGLVLDGGLALAAKVRAIGEAQEAARAGAQEIDLTAYRNSNTLRLMPMRASAAARDYLAAAGHTGTVSVVGNTVTVSVTISQPTQLLGLAGISSVTVTGTGQAEPQRGISGVSLGFVHFESRRERSDATANVQHSPSVLRQPPEQHPLVIGVVIPIEHGPTLLSASLTQKGEHDGRD